ncbi:hypothetical protein C3942_00900 [Solimonas fluminis]|uniref:Peptidase M15A C-terminal domain-containing protein n=1 Tax=Solimonas fluminis TaxID=2086571 RepID=A0A2S5TKJ4_9GAMM|nr:D-Ala-D-Ala carboxypeptidase family metallohydrolase [Solimonas fluminis]PPE75483.1 hypothetical protein C3942_00900 [Solimonas fluminis]
MISLPDFWMGRDKIHPKDLSQEIRDNAALTVAKVNNLLAIAKIDAKVSSGWRPPAINAGVKGAAKKSRHMTGQAVDLADPKGDLDRWCLDNLAELERIGLWLEHPDATPTWCHLQTVPPGSGRRVFRP